MKIVVDARIIYTSTGRYVERLLHHLQQIDVEHEYVVLLLKKDFERWQPTSPNFTKQVADYPPYTFREQIQFAFQLYRLRADLVHFTMPQQPLVYLRPHVTTVHDLTLIDFVNRRKQGILLDFYKYQIKPRVFRVAIWSFTHGSRHIITPTNFVKEQIARRFHLALERITVTYESAEVTAPVPTLYRPLEHKRFILYVGNAYPYKNLDRLVDAYKLIADPGYELVFVGRHDYFYRQLQDHIAEQQVTGITLTGFVDDAELAWLYQNAIIYVFPSLSEGFGLPGLEAMLYGLPVIASNTTSLPEVYGDAAVYFDPTSPQDMATRIDDLVHNGQMRGELKKKGAAHIKYFSWRRMAEQTHEVYLKALASRN
jgi:glycosyltransferase involved in cell wall biosynthesis